MTFDKYPKKVLIFSVAYYPKFVGGAEVAVKEITDRLNSHPPADGYEFHLLTLRLDKNLPKEEKVGNVFVYRLGFAGQMKESADSLRFPLHYNKYLYPFMATWKGLRLSKKHNFSFTWSIMANYSGFGALFFKFLKPKIPFLLTLQEGDPFDYIKKRVGLIYPLFKKIFTKADAVQAISRYLANWSKDMGFKGEPIVVPNGVDVGKFNIEISSDERSKIRKELGLGERDTALITTSRLVIKNGVGDVIQALANLPENIKFVIIGEGYLEEKLRLLAKNLGVNERARFKGFVAHNEMPKYLKACDIFIRASLSEGFGNSFIEAMAAGLPVIATPVGGIVDFLVDPAKLERSGMEVQTGYFCKHEDIESITTAINRSISDPNKKEVIENAKKMVMEKYDWRVIALQMKEIFDSLSK